MFLLCQILPLSLHHHLQPPLKLTSCSVSNDNAYIPNLPNNIVTDISSSSSKIDISLSQLSIITNSIKSLSSKTYSAALSSTATYPQVSQSTPITPNHIIVIEHILI